MIEAWRFAKQPYANDLSGEGAKRAGGRWNSRGFPVVYLAEHPALALVEIRAHLAVPYDDLPKAVFCHPWDLLEALKRRDAGGPMRDVAKSFNVSRGTTHAFTPAGRRRTSRPLAGRIAAQ